MTLNDRIEKEQLDHSLDFSTSPHLVQGLPFRERLLVFLLVSLSKGDRVTAPSKLRTIIPQ